MGDRNLNRLKLTNVQWNWMNAELCGHTPVNMGKKTTLNLLSGQSSWTNSQHCLHLFLKIFSEAFLSSKNQQEDTVFPKKYYWWLQLGLLYNQGAILSHMWSETVRADDQRMKERRMLNLSTVKMRNRLRRRRHICQREAYMWIRVLAKQQILPPIFCKLYFSFP